MNRPPQPKDYKIVLEGDPTALMNEVNKLISQGYIPIGGVSVSVPGESFDGPIYYCQAMVLI